MRSFQVEFGLLDFTLDLSRTLYNGLFSRPNLFKVSELLPNGINLFVEELNLLSRRIRPDLLDRFALDFELNKPALQSIHRLWFGVNLHANTAGCLVN